MRRDWDGVHIEDLESRNGVRVNKKRIGQPTTLRDSDEVEVGATRFLFVDPAGASELPSATGLTGLVEVPMPLPAAPSKRGVDGSKGAKKEPLPPPVAEAPPPELDGWMLRWQKDLAACLKRTSAPDAGPRRR